MKFVYLNMTIRAIVNIFLSILNKIITVLYMCLPLWVFMLVMQLRDKNNSATAIGTFLEDNSEFQFIFTDYILVANKPNNLKTNTKKKISSANKFIEKYKWVIALLVVLLGLVLIILH